MSDLRYSDNDVDKRVIPSFIEPLPPLIQNPYMRPRPQKGVKLFEEYDTQIEEPELVQVYLRLKPTSKINRIYEVRSDQCLVTSFDTTTAGHGRRTQHNVSKMYTFTRIFPHECNQKEIFEEVVKDNLKKLPEGYNFTLLTYGASGSGKTYTLMGTVGSPGLVPRSLDYVFRLVDASQEPIYKPVENGANKLSWAEQDLELKWVKQLRAISAPLRDKYRRMSVQLQNEFTSSSLNISNKIKYYVWVSFVEIYNEAIYDLLVPPGKRDKLRIREDSSGHVYVKGAAQAFVRSGEEAYDVMVAGRHNLRVAATGVHAHSSRSHCVFTITMLTEIDGEIRSSCVRLCDLAGCERARATRNTGARMQESRAINSSLHVLERCLHMLRRNQRQRQDAIVPYRESKLTRLLGAGLSGARGEAVSMVVTVNPSEEYVHETKHVLGLAAVAQDIQINHTIPSASSLETLDSTADTTAVSSSDLMRLKAENERLEFELMQAQDSYNKLSIEMETKQLETVDTMKELVEEAENLTKQYYEMQLDTLRSQMEEMKEEYEERLAEASTHPKPSIGTPRKNLENKVAQLMSEKAALQEELAAERLARARVEKQLQYLLAGVEQRDSEDESEKEIDDPLNESLNPVLRMKKVNKPEINNSKGAIELSSEDDLDSSDDYQKSPNKSYVHHEISNKNDEFSDTFKNDDTTPSRPSSNDSGSLIKNARDVTHSLTSDHFSQLTFDDRETLPEILPHSIKNDTTLIKSLCTINQGFTTDTTDNFSQLTFDDEKLSDAPPKSSQNKDDAKASSEDTSVLIKSIGNATKLMTTDEFSKLTFDDENFDNLPPPTSSQNGGKSENCNEVASKLTKSIVNVTKLTTSDISKLTFDDEKLTDTIFKASKKTDDDSSALKKNEHKKCNLKSDQFPKLIVGDVEFSNPGLSQCNASIGFKHNDNNVRDENDKFSSEVERVETNPQTISRFNIDCVASNSKSKISRGTYFVKDDNDKQCTNEQSNVLNTKDAKLITDTGNKSSDKPNIDERSFKSKVDPKKNMVKTLVESFESKRDKVINIINVDSPSKIPSESMIISNIIKNVKCNQSSDSSLLQFEQLEMATKQFKSPDKKVVFGDIKILKDKRNFFKYGSESSDDYKESYKIERNFDKQSPKPYITMPEVDQCQHSLNIVEKRTADNVKNNNGLTDVEKQAYYDFKIENSAISINKDSNKDALNSKSNLEKIINNVNSSIIDINNLNKRRPCGKENKIEESTNSIKCVKSPNRDLKTHSTNFKIMNNTDTVTKHTKEKHSNNDINPETDLFHLNEERKYFENVNANLKNEPIIPQKDVQRSPSIVNEDAGKDFKPSVGLTLLEETLIKTKSLKNKHNSMDIFEGFSPYSKNKVDLGRVGEPKESSNINDINKTDELIKDSIDINNEPVSQESDTITAFEEIYENISAARLTDFELLATDASSSDVKVNADINMSKETEVKFDIKTLKEEIVTQTSLDLASGPNEMTSSGLKDKAAIHEITETIKTKEESYEEKADIKLEVDPQIPRAIEMKTEDVTLDQQDTEDTKHNLRRKMFGKTKSRPVSNEDGGIVSVCNNSTKDNSKEGENVEKERPRRNLRLRRRKNQDTEEADIKLKDIANLQTEFCDVTMDKPAAKKEVKDIPSPETEVENLPPGIQSCPSKSVTRSRRKLFTPRAEPLEETPGQMGDSSERIRVPRPSYHRTRARRKL